MSGDVVIKVSFLSQPQNDLLGLSMFQAKWLMVHPTMSDYSLSPNPSDVKIVGPPPTISVTLRNQQSNKHDWPGLAM